jgi:hypothetical protein
VIGVGLNMDRVVPGIREACSSLAHGNGSERTRHHDDRPFPKEHAVRVTTPRGPFPSVRWPKGPE